MVKPSTSEHRRSGALLFACAILFGCAGKAHSHVHAHPDPMSEEADAPSSEEDSSPLGARDSSPDQPGLSSDERSKAADGPPPEPREVTVARAALHRIPEVSNHLGLVFAVAVRTADLPWVLALENRSPHDIKIAALPSLIQFEVTPPGGLQSTTCGSPLPTKLNAEEVAVLPAGEMLVHAFDPSEMCADHQILKADAVVKLTFGFPLDRKKVWKGGRLTESETEQKAPFLAERVENGQQQLIGVKHLTAETFTLGRTYPLREVSARPPPTGETSTDSESGTARSDEADVLSVEAPAPPLRVTIHPLGTSEKPETGLVNVSVSNTSGKAVLVHLRREYLTYEVAGPYGSVRCRMHPTELSAGSGSYSNIAPGASVNLATRLAEACPPGTFRSPGKYTVAVRFSPVSLGEERITSAFVGTIQGERVTTLHVPGGEASPLVHMKVFPTNAPSR